MFKTIVVSGITALWFFLASFTTASPAFAHALETYYGFDLMNAALTFTSGFSDGEALEGATVEIYAPGDAETPWTTLTTDANGKFSFLPDPQQPGEWTVKIGEGGHSDIWSIPVTPDGVVFEEISEGLNTDIHYADTRSRSGWLGLGSAVIGGLLYYGYKFWSLTHKSSAHS